MFINIQFNVKIKTTKVYSLKSIDRQFVDEAFNKFYKQKRMKYFNQSTSHNYSIFVI